MGHMGNGIQGVWGTWAIGAQGVWGTRGMGYIGNGIHGQWDKWAKGYRGMGNGAHGQFAPKISKRCQVVKLTSQMMVTKNPQNVHRKYFWAILMTFISDVKIDVNMCEPHYVNLFFFVNLLHSPDV